MLAIALLSGCGTPGQQYSKNPPNHGQTMQVSQAPVAATPTSAPQQLELLELLEFVTTIQRSPLANLRQLRRELEQRMANNPDDDTRLKLALLLGDPRTPERDPKQAQLLLQTRAAIESSHPQAVADLVTVIEAGWKRYDRQLQARRSAESDLAQERERRLAAEHLMQTTQRELEHESARRRVLEEKVKALNAIERHMRQRDSTGKSGVEP